MLYFLTLQYHNLHYRMEDKDFHKTFGVDSREKGSKMDFLLLVVFLLLLLLLMLLLLLNLHFFLMSKCHQLLDKVWKETENYIEFSELVNTSE